MKDEINENAEALDQEQPIKLNEDERVYDFGLGKIATIEKVVELVVKKSGNHRLKTEDGKLHIIPPGWIHIIITDNEKKDWTV
jgi:hypothetical protein